MTLPINFFHSAPIEAMPSLSVLRDAVLARSTKRMPKWKFRVAIDVVMQMQPRPATRTKANREGFPWFDCLAVVRGEADAGLLRDPTPDSWKIWFKLTIWEGLPPMWRFKATRIGFHTGYPQEDAGLIRDRMIATLPVAFENLRPAMMLQPACLLCSKKLTDPVPMARGIGPECYGSSSSVLPFFVELAA